PILCHFKVNRIKTDISGGGKRRQRADHGEREAHPEPRVVAPRGSEVAVDNLIDRVESGHPYNAENEIRVVLGGVGDVTEAGCGEIHAQAKPEQPEQAVAGIACEHQRAILSAPPRKPSAMEYGRCSFTPAVPEG